jgi:chromosomal replication initiator protein
LRHLLDNDPQATVRTIIETVSKVYVVMVQEMLGPRRAQALVDARHAAIVLAYIITKHSLPVIGRAFGGRDHTTVLHAVRKYKHIVDAHRQAEINAQAGDGQEIGL